VHAPPTIAVDAMGGDGGPAIAIDAALQVAATGRARLLLVGDGAQLAVDGSVDGIEIVHAPAQVAPDAAPAALLRVQADSSLHRMYALVREGRADAAVSGGNSGALMTVGRAVLGMLPGIDRPGMLATLPTLHGSVRMIDVGASLRARQVHLVQFARLGAACCRVEQPGHVPRVALLNVGGEASKGTDAIRAAAAVLRGLGTLDFRGFVEGDAIFEAELDVIVTDGFAGNVALKVAEGAARMARHLLALGGADGGALARRLLDVRPRNGACLLGLAGCAVKSHGNADRDAFVAAVDRAIAAVVERLVPRVAAMLAADAAGG
jgi:glycerol-3-phosphate acyltransferase PlsX